MVVTVVIVAQDGARRVEVDDPAGRRGWWMRVAGGKGRLHGFRACTSVLTRAGRWTGEGDGSIGGG